MIFIGKIKAVYDRSPRFLKAPLALIPMSILMGRHYRAQLKILHESNNWSSGELKKYQQVQLRAVLDHAIDTTPYYGDKKPLKKGLSFDQLKEFPLISKEDLVGSGESFYSSIYNEATRYPVFTGGSSGRPVSLMMSNIAYAKEWAFIHNWLESFGVSPNDKKLSVRGTPGQDASKLSKVSYNPIYRELRISPFHLEGKFLSSQYKDIVRFSPRYIHGYPSALEALAKISVKQGWAKKLNLKLILAISEKLYPQQRELIESVFGCPVVSFYGHTERVIFAGQKKGVTSYHTDPRYGFTEFIDGELVGTGFINYATPLIRYRTGDVCKVDAGSLDGQLEIKNIQGRWRQEMVLGKSGAKISVTALNMHGDVFGKIERFQYYQDEIGVLILRVVSSCDKLSYEDVAAMERAYYEKVGDELNVIVRVVDEIELTVRQKQVFLIQKLNFQ